MRHSTLVVVFSCHLSVAVVSQTASAASAPSMLSAPAATMASGFIMPSMASKAIAPVEQEKGYMDLNEAENEIQEEHDEDVGFDFVENTTADVYQQRQLEYEAIKLQVIEGNWTVKTRSRNCEFM